MLSDDARKFKAAKASSLPMQIRPHEAEALGVPDMVQSRGIGRRLGLSRDVSVEVYRSRIS